MKEEKILASMNVEKERGTVKFNKQSHGKELRIERITIDRTTVERKVLVRG